MENESRVVMLRNLPLGAGRPKVCVSVMGKSCAQLQQSALRALDHGAEILEIRIDSLSPDPTPQAACAACLAVRTVCGDTPLLFTQRTVRDGGAGSADVQAYSRLLAAAAASGLCDAVDVELSAGEDAFAAIAADVHAAGCIVVGSSHEFGQLDSPHTAHDWLLRQAALGADVCKAAVMPRDKEQAAEIALEMIRAAKEISRPAILIVMGEHGMFSRICAQNLGSCLSFGAAGEVSAPGQIDARHLRAALDLIYSTASKKP